LLQAVVVFPRDTARGSIDLFVALRHQPTKLRGARPPNWKKARDEVRRKIEALVVDDDDHEQAARSFSSLASDRQRRKNPASNRLPLINAIITLVRRNIVW